MTWAQAKKATLASCQQQPTRLAGVMSLQEGRSVVLLGYDQDVAVVLHKEVDLSRVLGAVTTALSLRKQDKKGAV